MDKIFNVPTAQRALSLVRQRLNEINRQKSEFLTKERFYFSLASDESESNKTCFEFLNRYRDNLRKLRNEENSLILLNKLLKKYMKENKSTNNSVNFTNESNSINYLPTIEEYNIKFNTTYFINKEFPVVTSKDVKRWFKNNPDKDYIQLFQVEMGNITIIRDCITIHRNESFKEEVDNYCYIFSADCFKSVSEFFVGKGHRKEYVQKCIDLYGSVECFLKDNVEENEWDDVQKVINIENGNFRTDLSWKYAEVILENFR